MTIALSPGDRRIVYEVLADTSTIWFHLVRQGQEALGEALMTRALDLARALVANPGLLDARSGQEREKLLALASSLDTTVVHVARRFGRTDAATFILCSDFIDKYQPLLLDPYLEDEL